MGMKMHNIQWMVHTTVKENDLGLTISVDMEVSAQYGIAAVKGNQIVFA